MTITPPSTLHRSPTPKSTAAKAATIPENVDDVNMEAQDEIEDTM